MHIFPFRKSAPSKPADRHISIPFSGVMLAVACSIFLSFVVCLTAFRYVMINSLLKSSSDNYARYCANQVGDLIGAESDPDYWEHNQEGLSLILTRVMRVEGIIKLQILDLDKQPVAEKTAEIIPDGTVRGEYEIRFNNRLQGWVVVSLVAPRV